MKVIFVSHYAKFYGANRALLQMVQGLKDSGVSPLVIIPGEGPVVEKLRESGIPFRIVPFRLTMCKHPRLIDSVKRHLQNRRLARRLANELAGEKADVIHSNSVATNFGHWLARNLGRPHVWHVREFGDLDYGLRPCLGKRRFLGAVLDSRAVIAISEAVKRHWFGSENSEKVRVVYDGVTTRAGLRERRRTVAQHELQRDAKADFVFVLVGLLQPKKSQHIAIQALQKVIARGIRAKLWIVGGGTGTYASECREMATAMGIAEAVTFWGYQDDPSRYYIEADAGLMCSEAEAYGLTTLESMSFCRPVIGHATGATPELIREDITGLLYEGGPDALAECMSTLARSRDLSRKLGENAWTRMQEEFTLEQGLEKIRGILGCEMPLGDAIAG